MAGFDRGVRPDRALVDHDRLVDELQPFDGGVFSRRKVLNLLVRVQRADQDAVDQGALSGTGDAGDAGEGAERNFGGYLFQIVVFGPPDHQFVSVSGFSFRRQFDFPSSGEEVGGQGAREAGDLLRGPPGDQFAAVDSGARSEVEHVVGPFNGVEIVFDHQHGVADVAEFFEMHADCP